MSFPRRRESTEEIVDPGLRRGDKDFAMENKKISFAQITSILTICGLWDSLSPCARIDLNGADREVCRPRVVGVCSEVVPEGVRACQPLG